MWSKVSPRDILAEHVVDIQKVVADFRDAFERIQSSSSQSYGVNKYCSSQSPVQKRLSIYNWNPGSRREKEDAFEKQIAVKWHIVTLQEASDDVDHDILQENLGECYNVLSRTSFRRQPRNGPKFFTVMSLHINNNYAKKRGIGKKLLLTIRAIMQEEHVHLVAGDFNGAAWVLSDGNNPQPTSTLEEAFADRSTNVAWRHTVVEPRCITM